MGHKPRTHLLEKAVCHVVIHEAVQQWWGAGGKKEGARGRGGGGGGKGGAGQGGSPGTHRLLEVVCK